MKSIKQTLCLLLASAFGLGLAPIAPGSFGALLGVLLHLGVVQYVTPSYQQGALILCLLGVSLVHFVLTPWSQNYWKDSDPGNFVLDEVAGYLVVPILIRTGPLWFIVVAGFLLFRIFDIIKIPPARQIDRTMHTGWGILLDDLVSGLYAAGGVYLLLRWCFKG